MPRHFTSCQIKSSREGSDVLLSMYLYLASVPCQLGSFRLIGGGRAQRPLGTRREGNGVDWRDEAKEEERKGEMSCGDEGRR